MSSSFVNAGDSSYVKLADDAVDEILREVRCHGEKRHICTEDESLSLL